MWNPLPAVDPWDALLVRTTFTKVPVTVTWSWVATALVAGLGAAGASRLGGTAGWGGGPSVFLVAALLIAVLGLQLAADRYCPPLYWLTVGLLTALVVSFDRLVDGWGTSPIAAVGIEVVLLPAALVTWWARERTLAAEAVTTLSRELHHWSVALLVVALGTSADDWLDSATGTGHWTATFVVGSAVAGVALVRRRGALPAAAAHWVLLGLVAPLGALLRDDVALPRTLAGGGLGAAWTDAAFLAAGVGVVAFLTLYRTDEDPLTRSLLDDERELQRRRTPHGEL